MTAYEAINTARASLDTQIQSEFDSLFEDANKYSKKDFTKPMFFKFGYDAKRKNLAELISTAEKLRNLCVRADYKDGQIISMLYTFNKSLGDLNYSCVVKYKNMGPLNLNFIDTYDTCCSGNYFDKVELTITQADEAYIQAEKYSPSQGEFADIREKRDDLRDIAKRLSKDTSLKPYNLKKTG